MISIEDEVVNTIRRNQKEFIDKYSCGSLDDDDKRAVNEIYEKKNIKALTGKSALQFCQRLQF